MSQYNGIWQVRAEFVGLGFKRRISAMLVEHGRHSYTSYPPDGMLCSTVVGGGHDAPLGPVITTESERRTGSRMWENGRNMGG